MNLRLRLTLHPNLRLLLIHVLLHGLFSKHLKHSFGKSIVDALNKIKKRLNLFDVGRMKNGQIGSLWPQSESRMLRSVHEAFGSTGL